MLVSLNQVKKEYSGFSLNCSMCIEEGKVTGIIGENGAGKSTTFKAILGLIQVEGEVKVFDKEVSELSTQDKERLGVVMAESGFSGYLRVKDLLPVMQELYPSFQKETFVRQCENFNLPLDKKIKEYSSGMKAKLKVLLALSHNADLLLLDEPTAGLDVVMREELLDLLRAYMEQDNRSILLSSHISSDLEGICDDIYMIHNGNIILHEDTHVLLDEYGVLKVTKEQYKNLNQAYLIKVREETYGYACLTNRRQYYIENHPGIAIEKSSIDDMILFLSR